MTLVGSVEIVTASTSFKSSTKKNSDRADMPLFLDDDSVFTIREHIVPRQRKVKKERSLRISCNESLNEQGIANPQVSSDYGGQHVIGKPCN
jgi:hypothetical protein